MSLYNARGLLASAMRTSTPMLVFLVILATPASAWAQEEACAGPFPQKDFVVGMNAADEALGEFDLERYRAILEQIHTKLPCTQEIVHPNHLSRFGLQKGLSAFLDQDEMSMTPWLTLSEVAGEAQPPPGFDAEDGPFQEAMDMVDPWINGPEGAGLMPPKGGAIILNGRLLTQPQAAAETPNFVQVVDKRGLVIESFWQEGSGFPSKYLVLGDQGLEAPKWYTEPDLSLDPREEVLLSDEERQRLEQARAEAQAEQERLEREQQAMNERLAAQQAKEEKRRARQEAKEQKRRARQQAKADKLAAKEAALAAQALEEARPDEWMVLSFSAERKELGDVDALELVVDTTECGDLLKIEPRALLGRLSAEEVLCLERELRHSNRITQQDRISRVLLADAFAKKEPRRWEAAIRRHLIEIDRSDGELCYIYARSLARSGPDRADETMRWADRALAVSRRTWSGDVLVSRVDALHRLKVLAARQKWFDMEQYFLDSPTPEAQKRANYWRNYTKTAAREWMVFAQAAGQEYEVARQLCISAAGSEVFCELDGS